MKNIWNIDKKIITLEEFYSLKERGCKRPFCKNGIGLHGDGVSEIVRVELKCERCSKVFTTPFSQVSKRSSLTLCTNCINHYKRTAGNLQRDSSYYEDEIYRKRISDGVKKHYREGGKEVVEKRTRKRFDNFLKRNYIPSFSAKKTIVDGIVCDSYGEGVFVQWMKEEGYSIERCNFYVEYFYNNKIHHYIPDFIIKKDSVVKVIEIKCEYLKNFESVYKYLEKRVQLGLQSSNNLSTYKKEVLELKQKAITDYCKERGWSFEMITLDNSKFNLLYNRAKRIRSNDKIGSKKNSSL